MVVRSTCKSGNPKGFPRPSVNKNTGAFWAAGVVQPKSDQYQNPIRKDVENAFS